VAEYGLAELAEYGLAEFAELAKYELAELAHVPHLWYTIDQIMAMPMELRIYKSKFRSFEQYG
jgi:hypothetical protein